MNVIDRPRYEHVRDQIYTGDVAGLRNHGPIEATSQSPWTHFGVCVHALDTLWLAEVREFKGGRLVTLSSQVKGYPGQWDIFRPTCPPHVARTAAQLIARQAGHPYGWQSVARAFLLRLNLCRAAVRVAVDACEWSQADTPQKLLELDRWLNPDTSDTSKPSDWDEPKHCSQTVAWGFRLAARDFSPFDWDLVPHKHDRYIEPADLGHSAALQLKFQGLAP